MDCWACGFKPRFFLVCSYGDLLKISLQNGSHDASCVAPQHPVCFFAAVCPADCFAMQQAAAMPGRPGDLGEAV